MTQISSPADRVKIKKMLGEISDSYTRMTAERDLIKEIVKEISDTYQIPRKTVKKIAVTFHKQNMTQVNQEHEEFVDLYEDLTKVVPK